jgi:hypothetical protein
VVQIRRVLRANQHKLEPETSKNSTICAVEVKGSERKGEAGQMTGSRLHGMGPHDPAGATRTGEAPTRPHRQLFGNKFAVAGVNSVEEGKRVLKSEPGSAIVWT